MAQAAGRRRAALGAGASSARSSRAPSARSLNEEPAELDARSSSSNARTADSQAQDRRSVRSRTRRRGSASSTAAGMRCRGQRAFRRCPRAPRRRRCARRSAAGAKRGIRAGLRRASSNACRSACPKNSGSIPTSCATPDSEAATLERLTAERERIGPVNLVAEQELAELDASAQQGAPRKPRS